MRRDRLEENSRWSDRETQFFKDEIKKIPFRRTHLGKLVTIDEELTRRLHIFIDAMLDEDIAQVIFRGETFESSYQKTGPLADFFDERLAKHCQSIFYIGIKSAAYFYETKAIERLNLHNVDVHEIRKLHHYLANAKFQVGDPTSAMKRVFGFSETTFVSKMMELSEGNRFEAKKYYSWLLHVIGETDFKSYSYFLSTSKDDRVASLQFGQRELVYCGWVPRPIKRYATYLRNLLQTQNMLLAAGLPIFENEPYPGEREVSLLNGLFPHFTFGVYSFLDDVLVINSHLLDQLSDSSNTLINASTIVEHGIDLDQTDFEKSDELGRSAYQSWVLRDEEGISVDYDIGNN